MEYEVGKRHLANMMGEDPDFFTQADINVCNCMKGYSLWKISKLVFRVVSLLSEIN